MAGGGSDTNRPPLPSLKKGLGPLPGFAAPRPRPLRPPRPPGERGGWVLYKRALRILSRIRGTPGFGVFAALGRGLERAGGGLEKGDGVAGFLRTLAPDEIATAVAFLAARAFPASDPRVLGVR